MRKVLIGILLIIFLFCQLAVMGIYMLDFGTREGSVRDAVDSTGIVSSIVTEAIGDNTVNNGGQYEEKINAIAESDSVTDFFAAYISSGIRETMSGNQAAEIADDELMNAVSSGIDEVNDEGTYTISSDDKALLMSVLTVISPDLSQGLTNSMSSFGATTEGIGSVESTSAYASVMQPVTRYIILAFMIIIIVVIAILTREHNRGWWELAVVSALPTALFASVAFGQIGEDSSMTTQFIGIMLQNGSRLVAIGGAILVAIFVIIAIINRRRLKNAEI